MRWKGRRASTNIEDRRGFPGGRAVGGGVGTLALLFIVWLLGGDPLALLDSNVIQTQPGSSGSVGSAQENELAEFVSVVLADTEDGWHSLFERMGKRYEEPKLVMFSGQERSACGFASAAVGPFYCPADQSIYIDLQSYDELKRRFGADGDFAQAYVIPMKSGITSRTCSARPTACTRHAAGSPFAQKETLTIAAPFVSPRQIDVRETGAMTRSDCDGGGLACGN